MNDCADFDGFSLHGAVRVAVGDRKRLEHLCRYAALVEPHMRVAADRRSLDFGAQPPSQPTAPLVGAVGSAP